MKYKIEIFLRKNPEKNKSVLFVEIKNGYTNALIKAIEKDFTLEPSQDIIDIGTTLVKNYFGYEIDSDKCEFNQETQRFECLLETTEENKL